MPVVGGNGVEFIEDTKVMVERLAADIDGSTSQVHLLYYIFACDGTGERIVRALEAAAGRGVACRVLVDGVASRRLPSPWAGGAVRTRRAWRLPLPSRWRRCSAGFRGWTCGTTASWP